MFICIIVGEAFSLPISVRDHTLRPNDTVTGPNPPNCCISITADCDVDECDLLAIRITRTVNTGALSGGAAATILMDLNE